MSKFDTEIIKFFYIMLILGLLSGLSACEANAPQALYTTKGESQIIGGDEVAPDSQLANKVIYLALGVEKKQNLVTHPDHTKTIHFSISQKEICTAVAISQRVLLTAAHCVKDFEKTPEQVNAALSANPWGHALDLKEWIQVEKIVVHPEYFNKDNIIQNDLAALRLSEDLDADRISTLVSAIEISNANLNLIAVGYGRTSALKDFADSKNGNFAEENENKKSLLNMIVKPIEKYEVTAKTFSIDQGDQKGICLGDSGGPGYIYDSAKDELLVLGLTSYVAISNDEKADRDPNGIYNLCLGHGHFTNLLAHQNWIEKTLGLLK